MPGQDDRDDRIVETGAERRDEGQSQDQAREGQEDIRDPHQQGRLQPPR